MSNNCLLEEPNCKGQCAHCGWNPKEAERRERALAQNGLTICKDGLARVIIKREG